VNPIREMVGLIEIQRTFQSVQKSIQGWDEATEKLLGLNR
ncbi:MAG TPA: hypothetical protein DIT22_05785, partial [Thermodesulfobacterium commune]|nr:hypothetical protein [Thermodesulfobacterium commune]